MTTLVDSQATVQTAVFTALNANAYISTTPIPVYDMVAKDAPTPFITIGDMTTVDDSTMDDGGQIIYLNVHTWDQDLSKARLYQMMAAVVATLHRHTLTLASGFTNINTQVMNSQTFKDPDGLTVHGVQKVRIVVEMV